jgi:hypothetical protein
MNFDPLQFPFEDLGVHRDSNSQSGSPLANVGVQSLTLSYTLGSMKCDSRASLLARIFTSPCFDRDLKAILRQLWHDLIIYEPHSNSRMILDEWFSNPRIHGILQNIIQMFTRHPWPSLAQG